MESISINRPVPGIAWKPYLLAAGMLGMLVLYVLAWNYPNFPGDEGALIRFQALRTGWLDDASVGFAYLGRVWLFLPAAFVLLGGLLIARRHADAALVVASLMVFGIGAGLKLLIDRPRPEYQLVAPLHTDPSFPSGHALLAVMMGGVLVYLVGRMVKPPVLRRAIQVALILAVLAMGASRVYLGVHWPSDVVGSYAFGVMALVGLIGFRNAVATAR